MQHSYINNTYPSDHLIGYWNLDEGQGDIINDTSGAGNQGIIIYPDITSVAYGDSYISSNPLPQDNYLAFSSVANASLYIGDPWKFNEINFTLSQTAGSGWSGVWEYWNGGAWSPLTINDGTNNMKQSGKIVFAPSADWTKTSLNGNHIYWVRLRCITSGSTGPVFHSTLNLISQYQWQGVPGVSGWAYPVTQINGVDNYTIPGWDPQNANGGDYVNDSEFANLSDTSATARLKYQSMVPAWYFINRWVMNLQNLAYIDYIKNKNLEVQLATKVDGIFMDNTQTGIPDTFWGRASYLEYSDAKNQYLQDAISSLTAMKQKLGAGLLIPNTNSVPFTTPSIIGPTDGFFAECMITYNSSVNDVPNTLFNQWSMIKTFDQEGKIAVIHGDLDPNGWGSSQLITMDPQEALDRFGLYSLARYYLIANNNTYFDYQNPSHYSTPWLDWFDAIGYNVGSPTGDYSLLKTVRAGYPNPPPDNLLVNPSFENSTTIPANITNDWTWWNWSGSTKLCSISNGGQDGAHSIEIDASSSSQSVVVQYVFQKLKTNTTYTLSGWIKTSNLISNSSPGAAIYIYGGAGGVTGGGSVGIPGGSYDWTFVNTVFTTGSDLGDSRNLQTAARIYTVNYGTAGTAYFDNIKLEEGAYPKNYIYARNFTNALVLLKPVPAGISDLGNNSATTIDLGAYFQPLNSNGSLGQPRNQVGIRNFEGMILIPASSYNLTVTTAGNGSYGQIFGASDVSNSLINCGANPTPNNCASSVYSGTVITLRAVPANGSRFSGWNINGSPANTCTGVSTPCNFTMNADTSVIANFTVAPIDGVCGQASQTYKFNATRLSGNLCSSGTANPAKVSFPALGRSVSWKCLGQDSGGTKTCVAKHSSKVISRL